MASCILAIDTSTARGEVAVLEGGQLLLEAGFESERSHNAQMFSPLREALEAAGDRLKRIVVGTGPGSYTGVRIGIAAAQGLAWARGVPVMGLPSLLVPKAAHLPPSFMVCGDARRGQFYLAQIVAGRLSGEVASLSMADFQARREAAPQLPWFSFDDIAPAGVADIALVKPSAAGLARLAYTLSDDEVQAGQALPLEPFYLSAPFVTQSKKK